MTCRPTPSAAARPSSVQRCRRRGSWSWYGPRHGRRSALLLAVVTVLLACVGLVPAGAAPVGTADRTTSVPKTLPVLRAAR